MLSNTWAMLMFVVKLSSFAKGQNPKTDIHNQKLGCAPKKYNSAILVRKKDTLQNFLPFLTLLLVQKVKGKITFE